MLPKSSLQQSSLFKHLKWVKYCTSRLGYPAGNVRVTKMNREILKTVGLREQVFLNKDTQKYCFISNKKNAITQSYLGYFFILLLLGGLYTFW